VQTHAPPLSSPAMFVQTAAPEPGAVLAPQ
jgi:hypothetical protein